MSLPTFEEQRRKAGGDGWMVILVCQKKENTKFIKIQICFLSVCFFLRTFIFFVAFFLFNEPVCNNEDSTLRWGPNGTPTKPLNRNPGGEHTRTRVADYLSDEQLGRASLTFFFFKI